MKVSQALWGSLAVFAVSALVTPVFANEKSVYTFISHGNVAFTVDGQPEHLTFGAVIEGIPIPVGTTLCVTSEKGELSIRDKNGKEQFARKSSPCIVTKALDDPSLMKSLWQRISLHLNDPKGDGEGIDSGKSRAVMIAGKEIKPISIKDSGSRVYVSPTNDLMLINGSWVTNASTLPITLRVFDSSIPDSEETLVFTQQSISSGVSRFVIPHQTLASLRQMKVVILRKDNSGLVNDTLVKISNGQWVTPEAK